MLHIWVKTRGTAISGALHNTYSLYADTDLFEKKGSLVILRLVVRCTTPLNARSDYNAVVHLRSHFLDIHSQTWTNFKESSLSCHFRLVVGRPELSSYTYITLTDRWHDTPPNSLTRSYLLCFLMKVTVCRQQRWPMSRFSQTNNVCKPLIPNQSS